VLDGRPAIGCAELAEDRGDVVGNRPLGEMERSGHRRIRRPAGHLLEYLLLAAG
jgi:hypothetical protein